MSETAPTYPRTPAIRVLLICAVNGHGGPIQSIKSVVSELSGSTDFLVATQLPAAPTKNDLTDLCQDVIPIIRPRGRHSIRAAMQLLRHALMINKQVDIIHANGLTELMIALPISIVARKPIVVWIHNFELPTIARRGRHTIRALRSRITAYAVSRTAAELIPELEASIILNPIDPTTVATERVNSNTIRVGYLAGTDRHVKGFDLLPDIIASSNQRAEWRLYSSPPHSAHHPACLAAWDRLLDMKSSRVQIVGRVEDISSAFAQIDLLVAPSRQESFNRTIAEALANGIPVVASDIAPHCELLATGGGTTYPVEDYLAASAEIDRFCSDAELRERTGRAGRSHAEQFAPRKIAKTLDRAWREALL